MRSKRIGIIGWSLGDNSFGVTKPYLKHLQYFGEVVILGVHEGVVPGIDLIVMPGGADILSSRYGMMPNYANGMADPFKEWFAIHNLPEYIKAKVPVYGTCLGMQQIAVHFGAQLAQDISGEHGYSEEHRGELVNELIFTERYKKLENDLKKGLKKNEPIKVCSLHHQALMTEDCPEELDVVAHTADNVAEAIIHKTLPIAGGQFHVEEDWNRLGMWMIHKLLNWSPKQQVADAETTKGDQGETLDEA